MLNNWRTPSSKRNQWLKHKQFSSTIRWQVVEQQQKLDVGPSSFNFDAHKQNKKHKKPFL
jgi:hypothetical protein